MRKAIRSEGDAPRQGKRVSSAILWSAFICAAVAALAIFLDFHAAAQTKPPAHPLDLNSATVEQIKQLPGLPKGIAEAIVKFREKSGPFQRIEDLRAIRGISKARFEKIRPFVTVKPLVRTSG